MTNAEGTSVCAKIPFLSCAPKSGLTFFQFCRDEDPWLLLLEKVLRRSEDYTAHDDEFKLVQKILAKRKFNENVSRCIQISILSLFICNMSF